MIRTLAILAVTFGSFSVFASDATAGGSSYHSYDNSYRSTQGSLYSRTTRTRSSSSYGYGSYRNYGGSGYGTSRIGYGDRSYNRQRSYSSGYSRGSSYSLQSSPYYTPYQSPSSSYGSGSSYGYGSGSYRGSGPTYSY